MPQTTRCEGDKGGLSIEHARGDASASGTPNGIAPVALKYIDKRPTPKRCKRQSPRAQGKTHSKEHEG